MLKNINFRYAQFILLFFINFNITLVSMADCLSPRISLDCDFYKECLETKKSCGNEGYAIAYGDYYCRRFLNTEFKSENAIKWRNSTMLCLQNALSKNILNTYKQYTCESIENYAFITHERCYTQPGSSICKLPISDWESIMLALKPKDIFSKKGFSQTKNILATCIQGFLRKKSEQFIQLERDEEQKVQFFKNMELDQTFLESDF